MSNDLVSPCRRYILLQLPDDRAIANPSRSLQSPKGLDRHAVEASQESSIPEERKTRLWLGMHQTRQLESATSFLRSETRIWISRLRIQRGTPLKVKG